MAYRRNLTIRARIFAQQRFTPSISHLNHNEDRTNQHSDDKLNSFLQSRSYGVYSSNNNNNYPLRFRDPKWCQVTASGFLLARNMSTSIKNGDGVGEKIEYINDIATVVVDETMEIVSNQAAPVVSEVALAAADSWLPVAALQYAIDGIHTFTGLNWWASIAITTLVIRTLLIPLMINQQKATAKLTILRPELEEIRQKMQDECMSPTAVAEGQERMNMVFKKHGVSMFTPFKMLFIQLPVFLSFFFAIQNMTAKVASFKIGGASWFLDLTTADSFYILPCLNAYAFWIFSECYLPAGKIKNVARFLVALSIPFLASFPQALLCHWITSNLFFLVYKLTMKQEPVKKFFNIPIITPPPPPSPASESEPASESKSNSSD